MKEPKPQADVVIWLSLCFGHCLMLRNLYNQDQDHLEIFPTSVEQSFHTHHHSTQVLTNTATIHYDGDTPSIEAPSDKMLTIEANWDKETKYV